MTVKDLKDLLSKYDDSVRVIAGSYEYAWYAWGELNVVPVKLNRYVEVISDLEDSPTFDALLFTHN